MPENTPTSPLGASTEPPVTGSDTDNTNNTDNTDNSASTLIEAPIKPGTKNPLDLHEFADGGGGGGAEAFRRKQKP